MNAFYGLWALVSGHHLDGEHRSNATWWRPGDDRPGPRDPDRWARQPRAHRAFYRVLGLAGLILAVTAAIVNPAAAKSAGVGVFWLATSLGAYGFYRWCGKYGHYSDKYVLMHRKMHALVGWNRHKNPRSWLSIPPDYADNPEAACVFTLPDELRLTDGLQRKIENNAKSVLDIQNPDAQWSRGTRPMTLTMRTRPAPPSLVTYADILEALEAREPGTIVLGKGDGALAYGVSPQGENPHMVYSAPTGKGKSSGASVMSMQVLHDGANALVCDIKLVSIPWARTLPSVRYCSRISHIHNALCWLGVEIDRRFDAMEATVDREGNVDRSAVGAPLWVYLEEANSLIPDLVEHWRDIKDTSDSPISPAIRAIRRAMTMGRGADVHLVGIAQYLTAAAIGGPTARQNFQTRIMLGPDDATLNLLVGREYKVKGKWPETLKHPGAAMVLNNGRLERCQIALVQPREALDYATSGIVTPFPESFDEIVPVPGRVPAGSPGSNVIALPGRRDRELEPEPAEELEPDHVTLAEACRSGLVPLSYETARKRRTRAREDEDSTFPIPKATRRNEELYDRDELAAWFGANAEEA